MKPKIVIEADFASWTQDSMIRHSSLEGVREDMEAKEVVLETAVDAPAEQLRTGAARPKRSKHDYGSVKLSHPDRVLWADVGVTKQMLADYYAAIAPRMMPHIVNRPLSLLRWPDGTDGKCFFQGHMGQGLTDAVESVKVKGDKNPCLAIRNEIGLFTLVQFSALEVHPWGAQVDDLNHPDRIVMDFDPGDTVLWNSVKAAALECRQRLSDMGSVSFIKTTGGKGLHVVVPITRHHAWPDVKAFAAALGSTMAADNRIYITRMTKCARRGRIFVDYLRNDRTATAIAPYSTRARAGAPIALPIDWSELRALPSANHYTLRSASAWLWAKRSDPWEDMSKIKQRLTAKAKKNVGLD